MPSFPGIDQETLERLHQGTAELPPGVGPHEGKELSLMLDGRKPVAMFYDTISECGVIPRHEFEPYIESGRLVRSEMTFSSKKTGSVPVQFVFYAQTWATGEMDELIEIHRRIYDGSLTADDEMEARIGRLLGYTELEIDAYLAWHRHVSGGANRQ